MNLIETERLILRKWTQDDAESLFIYAKNPNVGPIAGWPPHKDIESSKYVIDVQDPGNALDALMFVLAIDTEKCSRN